MRFIPRDWKQPILKRKPTPPELIPVIRFVPQLTRAMKHAMRRAPELRPYRTALHRLNLARARVWELPREDRRALGLGRPNWRLK